MFAFLKRNNTEDTTLPKSGVFKKLKRENIKQFFAKLSRGLMLPIAILPIAGLLLGIGGAIGANMSKNAEALVAANIFKSMSDVVFANLAILFCVAITITFSKDKGTAGFLSALAYLVFCSSQLPFIQFEEVNGKLTDKIISVLWFHKELQGLTGKTLGMPTINTSIFGGIVVGALTSFIYNRISEVKLPQALDFFSGVRLVPFILIPTIFITSLIFLIFWPWIGLAIIKMGSGIQGAPAGTGGLLYGVLGRALMPFGLHHIPIVLAFQTDFGGVLELSKIESLDGIDDGIKTMLVEAFKKFSEGKTVISGDQSIWNFINSINENEIVYNGNKLPLFLFFKEAFNVHAGRFTQDYPTYLGLCMGIGLALILTSSKENRKTVTSVIGSSMAVAFLTGITEPLEFTFLFCAPWLYFLVYVPLSGFSYMFMELVNAHVGVGFARGFIDLMIYGALPVLKGTNFYWAFILAIIEGIFIFVVFYFSILKFNLATPGRGNNPMNLITKKDYQAMKSQGEQENSSPAGDIRIFSIINLLGGKENIVDVSACATRLRVSVNESSKIDGNAFVPLGSKGSIIKGNGVQIIFGGEASIIADKINEIFNSGIAIPKNVSSKNETSKSSNEKTSSEQSKDVKPMDVKVYAPFNGEVVDLKDVPDDLFSTGALGHGIALKPSTSSVGSVLSSGELVDIFHTKHAYTFKAKNGIEVLLHIGIDSAKNGEKIFRTKAKLGKVTKASDIASINMKEFDKAKSKISPIVVPSLQSNEKIVLSVKKNQKVKKGDLLFTIKK